MVGAIEQLEREQDALERSSDMLRTLQQQFTELSAAQEATEAALSEATVARATATEKRLQATQAHDACAILFDAMPEPARDRYFPLLQDWRTEALGAHSLTMESCEQRERDMRSFLQARIDGDASKLATLCDRIIRAMQDYTKAWPLDTCEVDVNIDAAGEFGNMLDALQADDLPRFAVRFKELLNENTIREIAGFQSQLKRERETIRERIATINGSLQAIDYNPSRYIALEAELNVDADLRDFQQDLRTCTDGGADRLG